MNSIFSHSRFLAAAVSLAALAGCNAVEDVRSEPFITLPPATVVLQGTVTGLGSERSLGLKNNGNLSDSLSVQAATPVGVSTSGGIDPVVFSFGSRAVTDANGNPVPYDIQFNGQPYGRICQFRDGSVHSGILSVESPPNILIDCVPNPAVPVYNVDVILDPAFANAAGAKVQLRTEDAVYEQAVTPAHITAGRMTFVGKVFNGAGPGSPNGSPAFAWTVSASTNVGGTLNKCPVLRPSGSNPAANITAAGVAPQVLACSFTISGAVHYSRPAEVAADPALGAGLTLELRDLNGVKKGTATVAAGAFPAGGIPVTFNNTDTPATNVFTSNPNADFQVVVTSQPAGQTCMLPDGGYVSLKSLVLLNPVSVTATGVVAATGLAPAAGPPLAPVAPSTTSANAPVAGTRLAVFCRNKPSGTTADTIRGTYRLTKTTATLASTTGVVSTVTSAWLPFDFTVQNTASNNVITFFDDGTFLYGTHHSTNQVEHGFYDYSSTLKADNGAALTTQPGRLRFTLHTDTFPNTVFPIYFSTAEQNPNNNLTTTPGISALPGALSFTGAPNAPAVSRHVNLGNVVRTAGSGSTPAKISATAGPFGGTAANYSTGTFTFAGPITANGVARQVSWELTEVASISGEMTGGWISQDHRRFWTWDKATDYGFHVGVNGIVNLQSSCFVTEEASSPSGTYQRRSAQTLCYPINRPRTGQTLGIFDTLIARDVAYLTVTHWVYTNASFSNAPGGGGGTSPGGSTAPAGTGSPTPAQNVAQGEYSTAGLFSRFPNYESRIPGGNSALDGRSPSPNVYYIAPATTFFAAAPAEYFPQPAAALSTWCTSDILGIRATLNGVPFREPIYLCRTRAN